MNDLAAIVLCGGASRRMGRDKATLPFGDETMLERVVRVVGQVCAPVVVVAGPAQALPELPSTAQVVRDPYDQPGPVAAIRLGLETLHSEQPVFVCGSDMPFVSAELIQLLVAHYRPGHIVVTTVAGVEQPLGAIFPYQVRTLPPLQTKALRDLFQHVPVVALRENELCQIDPGFKAFMRINDPESYNKALEIEKNLGAT